MAELLAKNGNLMRVQGLTAAHLVILGLGGVAGGVLSALMAAGEYRSDLGALSFSWSGAAVTFTVGFAFATWRWARVTKLASGRWVQNVSVRDPTNDIVLAMLLAIAGLGLWVLPSVPRAYGGTAPVCRVLHLNPEKLSPQMTAALGGTRIGDEIVTPPVALHPDSGWGTQFMTAHSGPMGLYHEAVVSRAACSDSEMEQYRDQAKWARSAEEQ